MFRYYQTGERICPRDFVIRISDGRIGQLHGSSTSRQGIARVNVRWCGVQEGERKRATLNADSVSFIKRDGMWAEGACPTCIDTYWISDPISEHETERVPCPECASKQARTPATANAEPF